MSGSEAMGGAGGVDDGAGGEGGAVDDGPWISSSRQVARLAGYQSAPQSYWEYLPPSYEAQGTPSPLLIFFHGIGENGDGSLEALNKVPVNGPPMVIETDRWPKERPFVVLSPQNASNCPTSSAIAALLTWAQSTYNLDANRLYLTGLSCGAIGISSYLANNVDTTSVAAAVVISGDMRSAWNAQGCDVGKVAIWGIHGDADANGGTQPDFTRLPMQSLIACPRPPRKNAVLNMIAGGTHSDNTWDTTYLGTNGLDVYGWLLDNAK